jgi:hypothetical protein
MLKNAIKYMLFFTATKKMFNFARKPIIGGMPAIENSAVINIIDNILFDFFNKAKSPKSLFCFILSVFFNRKSIKTDQMHTPEPI